MKPRFPMRRYASCLSAFLMAIASLSTADAEETKAKGTPASKISFTKFQVDPVFESEGVAIGDVNRDGQMDIFAGDVWYETLSQGKWKRHQLREPRDRYDGTADNKYDGTKGYSNSFANFAQDVNNDGWVDLIIVAFPGEAFHWYENPKGAEGLWKQHEIWRSACNETPIFADLLGDGRKGVILAYQPESQIGFFRPGADPIKIWEPLALTEKDLKVGTHRFWHGLGAGDVNQDGRQDVIINAGWWEQPADPKKVPWKFHELSLAPPPHNPPDPTRDNPNCADIHVYDVDGDGDNDIISSAAHHYGIWWFEQTKTDKGAKYVPHVIRDDFSQTHALHLQDINGDGIKDLITGKRYFAHQGKDPGGREPVVLYWIEIQRENGKPKFISHSVAEGVGHGTQFVVDDFDGDKLLDIVTSNKKGTHVLLQRRQ